MKITLYMLLMILLSGCATVDRFSEWKNYPKGLEFDDLDNLYEKYFKDAKKDEDGWVKDTVQKVDFGGPQKKGKLTFKTKDMKPGPGTGTKGTTGSGNHPERFFLRLKSKGYSKTLDLYTMHKGRNGVRARVKSEDKSISIHIGGFITHGDRPDSHEWSVWWENNKVWVAVNGELCNDDDNLPWTVGNSNVTFRPEAAYLGGGGERPFEGSWKDAEFTK